MEQTKTLPQPTEYTFTFKGTIIADMIERTGIIVPYSTMTVTSVTVVEKSEEPCDECPDADASATTGD
jgi:hypothetical protein